MLVSESQNFIPKIKVKEIKYLQYDYELKLEDLKDLHIEYDDSTNKIYATFETIYINDLEKLTKINLITGKFKYYSLNGFYEKQENKAHNITIGQDIIDYLFNWEKKYFEERNKNECI